MRNKFLAALAVCCGLAVVGVGATAIIQPDRFSSVFAGDVQNEFAVRRCPTCPKTLMQLRTHDNRTLFLCEDCNKDELQHTLRVAEKNTLDNEALDSTL
jgi:hypothetical protein